MSTNPTAVEQQDPPGQLKPWDPQPVKAILAELGLSQHRVSKRPGLTLDNLNKMVNGRKAPSLRYVEALEEVTGRPYHELFHPDAYAKCHWYVRRLRSERLGTKEGGGANA